LFQRNEMAWPKSVEEVAHGAQSVGAHHEQVASAIVPFGDQTGSAQDVEVVRDGLLRHGDLVSNLADGARGVAHGGQDAATIGIGEGVQGGIDAILRESGGGG
jgi:hypothetical protein